MAVTIPTEAARLIERLARTAATYHEPRVDTAAVERAIQEHLRRLEVEGLTVRFVTDFAGSRRSAVEAALDADEWITPWRRAWRDARREACSAAPWRVVRRLAEVSAGRAVALAPWTQLRWGLLDLEYQEDLDTQPDRWEHEAPRGWVSRQALLDALAAAVEVVAWTAEPETAPPIDRWIGILSPLVDAFEAGLWLCWIVPGEVRAVLRPAARFANRRLHCEDGPAVAWPGGPSYYFWHGVRVPANVVLAPLELRGHEITSESNAEVRRVMLERYGSARFIQDIGATLVDADETGELYRQQLQDDEPLCMVRVLDATPGSDGTRRAYWLRVPPTVETAREAVAWTFGMETARYHPVQET